MVPSSPFDDRPRSGARRAALLASLSPAELALVAPLMRERRFQKGDTIFNADDPSEDLFIIEQGDVWIYADTPYGHQPLAELGGGALFGELSLLDSGGRCGIAEARSFVTLWQLDGRGIRTLFQDHPPLVYPFFRTFWRSLASRIYRANELVKELFSSQIGDAAPPPADVGALMAGVPEDVARSSETSRSVPGAGPKLDPDAKQHALEAIGLSPPEIDLLFQYGQEKTLRPGTRLFSEGDYGDSLYIILGGEVRISKTLPGLGEEALAFLREGEIFGEMALASDDSCRSADCYAHEGPVFLLSFSRSTLDDLKYSTKSDLPFLQALCKMMAHRLREIYDKLVSWRMMAGGF